VEETKWMFEELKSQIPWQEKNIKVQGNLYIPLTGLVMNS
jgi:hypothetical protein